MTHAFVSTQYRSDLDGIGVLIIDADVVDDIMEILITNGAG